MDTSANTTHDAVSPKDGEELDLISLCGMELLEKFMKNLKETGGKVSQADLLNLHWAFGPVIQSAFEMVDNHDEYLHIFETPSERFIVRVSGSKGDIYWIAPGACTCQCVAFKWKRDFCKHILAAHIHLAMIHPDDDTYQITDEQLNKLYSDVLTK